MDQPVEEAVEGPRHYRLRLRRGLRGQKRGQPLVRGARRLGVVGARLAVVPR